MNPAPSTVGGRLSAWPANSAPPARGSSASSSRGTGRCSADSDNVATVTSYDSVICSTHTIVVALGCTGRRNRPGCFSPDRDCLRSLCKVLAEQEEPPSLWAWDCLQGPAACPTPPRP